MQKGKTSQKQTFLGGAAVLALATATVKIIGAVYKLPLKHILGNDGFAYFGTAYEIFTLLLTISTAGLPIAMSRMISEAKTLGQTRQIRQIYRVSRTAFLTIGAVGTALMALFCRQLAAIMNMEQSWFAILCLSPALLFIGILSVERGFFQGQANMVPTSVSQVLEALCKLLVGLGLAWLYMALRKKSGLVTALPDGGALPEGSPEATALTLAHSKAAGFAILGVTLGTAIGSAYLVFRRRRDAAELEANCLDPTVSSAGHTMRKLLSLAVPITLGAAGYYVITTVDSAIYMGRLKGAAGLSAKLADDYKGIYFFAQTIFNLPIAFIGPLTISAIPAITEQLTLRRRRRANVIAESAVRVMALIALPCSIGLAVLSEPIMQLMGGYSFADYLELASVLMRILGACVFFVSFTNVMTAILQAHGCAYLPVCNMIVGAIAKVVIDIVLVSNPQIHIIGVPIGTVVCYMLIAMLDLVAIRLLLQEPPRLLVNVIKPALAALLMGVAAFALNRLCLAGRLPLLLRTCCSILGAGAVYLVLVVRMKIITREDCDLLPKGDRIAKLLRID